MRSQPIIVFRFTGDLRWRVVQSSLLVNDADIRIGSVRWVARQCTVYSIRLYCTVGSVRWPVLRWLSSLKHVDHLRLWVGLLVWHRHHLPSLSPWTEVIHSQGLSIDLNRSSRSRANVCTLTWASSVKFSSSHSYFVLSSGNKTKLGLN